MATASLNMSNNSKPVQIGLVGYGWWGKTITDRMQASTEMRITRAVDLFPEKQGDYTAKYGVPVTGDYAEVLADPDVHAVILTTPNSLHTAQIAAAAATDTCWSTIMSRASRLD